jgi:polysaccharide export outer membrane protein
MSRRPVNLFCVQGCLIWAALFVLAGASGWVRAQTEESSTPLQATTPAARDEAIPTETASSTYLLQPYDLIDVDVYSEEDLHKPARLGSDGTVLLPLIGSVKVGGLTVAQATELISNRYAAGFVKNPSVLITVLQYRKSTFSILGQVLRPGIYEIPEGAQVSILEAVSLAAGFMPTAAQNSVTVKRMVDGKDTIFKVKAGDMAQNPDAVPFDVLPGDTILVPASQFRNSTFSILGQVEKPGIYEIPEGTHLNIIEAILTAGGYTRTAAQNSVTVKRTVNGKLTTIKVRAGDMAQEADLVPFEVLPGDIIKVNESWY